MKIFRIVVLALAVVHAVLAVFTGLVGGFADGGSLWERLILMAVHPITAAALLYVVALRQPARRLLMAATALIVLNLAADAVLALLILSGNIRGDWELALVFSAVPLIGLAYCVLALTRGAQGSPETS